MDEKKKLLAKVAYMYYVEEMTQAQISKELNIYRTTVSRMLSQAKQEGIVEIKINRFDAEIFALERVIKETFGLKQLEIVPTDDADSTNEKDEKLAQAAANILRKQINNGSVVGVSWGASVGNAVRKTEKNT